MLLLGELLVLLLLGVEGGQARLLVHWLALDGGHDHLLDLRGGRGARSLGGGWRGAGGGRVRKAGGWFWVGGDMGRWGGLVGGLVLGETLHTQLLGDREEGVELLLRNIHLAVIHEVEDGLEVAVLYPP